MNRRRKIVSESESLSIWTAYTDLMSNAFMVITLLLLLVVAKYLPSTQKDKNKTNELPNNSTELTEAQGYTFESGKATLGGKLKSYLRDDKNESGVLFKIQKYPKINVIEVIGHTDYVPVATGQCYQGNSKHLDQRLEPVVTNPKKDISTELCASSNTDLGLMRALAVIRELQKVTGNDPSLKHLQFRAYSAGQLLLPNNKGFASPPLNRKSQTGDPSRRRIEIRFTKNQ